MSPVKMSKVESASRLALELNGALNGRDEKAISSLLSEDCIFEDKTPPPDGSVFKGKEAILNRWRGFFKDHPEALIEVEDVKGFGDRCILFWVLVDPGKGARLRGIDIYSVKQGNISEIRSYAKG